jgi:threonine dehydrogenase-like Zn-dependent dehydrogenase
MKALTWHGKHDIRCESVPDQRIEEGRDAIIKVTACAILLRTGNARRRS